MGVMEKTDSAWLYPATFGWFDIGSWEALYDFAPTKDRKENAIRAGKTLVDECRGNLVLQTRPEKLVAVKGLEDFIVVDTDDVLMICPRDDKSFKDFISDIAMPDFEEYR